MGPERETTSAAVVPFGVSHRSRLAEVYARHAPEGIRLAYLITGDRRVQRPESHALPHGPGRGRRRWPRRDRLLRVLHPVAAAPGEFHRLTLVHP